MLIQKIYKDISSVFDITNGIYACRFSFCVRLTQIYTKREEVVEIYEKIY